MILPTYLLAKILRRKSTARISLVSTKSTYHQLEQLGYKVYEQEIVGSANLNRSRNPCHNGIGSADLNRTLATTARLGQTFAYSANHSLIRKGTAGRRKERRFDDVQRATILDEESAELNDYLLGMARATQQKLRYAPYDMASNHFSGMGCVLLQRCRSTWGWLGLTNTRGPWTCGLLPLYLWSGVCILIDVCGMCCWQLGWAVQLLLCSV